MMQSALLKDLNPAQQEAVQNTEGPVLVLAGAGSGKTRVLTYRIAYIIGNDLARPEEILAVTFTNKAANEMKWRVEKLLNISVQQLWIGTFHSISARILHREAKLAGYQSNFTIYDTTDQENLIKRIMEHLNLSREKITPRYVQYVISEAKNKLIDAKKYNKTAADFKSKQIAKIFFQYEVSLRRNNAFDFDDLIIKPIEIFTDHPEVLKKYQKKFRYILVDEYQDTNKAQYYWIKLLAQKHRNLCVVGDEDQSIYRWRGADIGNILNFEQDYAKCKVVRLEQNYRSTQTILSAANAVVSYNMNRLGKNLWSEQGTGEPIRILQAQDEMHEGALAAQIIQEETLTNGYSLNDMVILYRTNAQSRALEEQLRRAGLPYTIVGGTKFYDRKEIKDILAYLKLLVNPNDSVSLQRIINFPTRGIGDTTLKSLNDYAFKHQLSLYEAIFQIDDIPNIRPGSVRAIKTFSENIQEFRDQLNELNAYQITEGVINKFGLKAIYEQDDNVENEGRIENINELLNGLQFFVSNNPHRESLQNYLDEISLLTDIDRWDPEKPSVTLMTLHSAKGLEFPVVLITGLENGLLPLSRNNEEIEQQEEERRLFYVGMTRAKKKLYLLHARLRHRFSNDEFGMTYSSIPSPFLREIPGEFIREEPSKHEDVYSSKMRRVREKKTGIYPHLEELPDENSEFKIGQYVHHDVFGKGQILGVDSSRIGTKITIQFEKAGIKKLIAEYARLSIGD
ncbi:MAG: ATP-dependent DNA helicase PcrA [Calditrichaeota bacterium]|nr:UvrD-helicase domain-containing protein [Calditrichota bacterium]RQW07035.1 MAG: ATP-dependent DNA helicase PcrA [Calditrichota bacterium]